MTLSIRAAIPFFWLLLANLAFADRGPIIWNEDVALSQESQKAIILHNRTEEILILGTEMKANRETEILEFIPFPSEPQVSPASGNPFEEIGKLIAKKGLVFEQYGDVSRGGGGDSGGSTEPVEIRFSEKIGLHDVTAIKIHDIDQFSRWLEDFFRSRGIPARKERLQDVYDNARDYLQRGYAYFVFDSVKITANLKFLEPLVYRFKTDKIYFPLKTSNLIGGTGTVEMILILPGSVSDDLWQSAGKIFGMGTDREIRLSSSSKLYPEEVTEIYDTEPFFERTKVYLQVLKYSGPYDFKDDFTYDVHTLDPYAYRFDRSNQYLSDQPKPVPALTADENRDMREYFCPKRISPEDFLSGISRFQVDCWDFIPNDAYEVYSALFAEHQLSGVPSGNVILEKSTVQQEYKGRNTDDGMDPDITKNFNENNRVSYTLENAFPDTGGVRIQLRNDRENDPFAEKGRTGVSRVGFNPVRTEAMVYVEHIAGPRAGVGYYVTLQKKNGEWEITGNMLGVIY